MSSLLPSKHASTHPSSHRRTSQCNSPKWFHRLITARPYHTPGLKFAICKTTQWPFKLPTLCKTPLRSLKAEKREEAVVSSLKRTLILDIQHEHYPVSWINAPSLLNLKQLHIFFY